MAFNQILLLTYLLKYKFSWKMTTEMDNMFRIYSVLGVSLM